MGSHHIYLKDEDIEEIKRARKYLERVLGSTQTFSALIQYIIQDRVRLASLIGTVNDFEKRLENFAVLRSQYPDRAVLALWKMTE